MKTYHPTLTKSQLAETIISTLSLNKLGYKFFKSNYRYYYFRRESSNKKIIDIMVICVYLRIGRMRCSLYSSIDNRTNSRWGNSMYGFCRKVTLYKSTFDKTKYIWEGPGPSDYCFNKSVNSLNKTLHLLLADLDHQGTVFLNDSDKIAVHSKFLCAMKYLKELTTGGRKINNEIISNMPKEEKHFIDPSVVQDRINELIFRLGNIKSEFKANYYDPWQGWREIYTDDKMLASITINYAIAKIKGYDF